MTSENLDRHENEGSTPAQQADDMFVHGLLESYYVDTPEMQEARIERVMGALHAPGLRLVGTGASPAPATVTVRTRRFLWRLAPLAAAAGLALAVIVPAMMPPSATAMVRSSLDAARTGGDRRYEVRARLPGNESLSIEPIATVDVRGVDRMAIRLRTPRGETIWTGRDGQGSWSIRPDGTVDRLPPKQGRPRWLDMGESTMLVESVADLLEELERGYDLTRTGAEAMPGESADAKFDRITARRRSDRGPEPIRIELWLEPATHLVHRMELHWPEHSFGPNRPVDGRGPGPGGGRDGKGMGGPPGGQRPEGGPFGDGPRGGEPGMPGDRPPLFDGPGPHGSGPKMGPHPAGKGPLGPKGPGDGPPPGDGPREGRRPGPPHGVGPGGPEGPRPGGQDFGPPRFLEGPPEFGPPPGGKGGPGRHAPPPRMIAFQRVPSAQFEEAWFTPDAHKSE